MRSSASSTVLTLGVLLAGIVIGTGSLRGPAVAGEESAPQAGAPGSATGAKGNEATPTRIDRARAAAEAWLLLVDKGDYDGSWEAAASLFRNAVTKDQWRQAASAARMPLGPVVSRKVKSTKFTETLPGAPDGEYVVIEFATEFEKKAAAVETVTPMLDSDGAWHVSGYFVR